MAALSAFKWYTQIDLDANVQKQWGVRTYSQGNRHFLETAWGRIGAKVQSKARELASKADAVAARNDLIAEKVGAGYKLAAGPAKPKAKPKAVSAKARVSKAKARSSKQAKAAKARSSKATKAQLADPDWWADVQVVNPVQRDALGRFSKKKKRPASKARTSAAAKARVSKAAKARVSKAAKARVSKAAKPGRNALGQFSSKKAKPKAKPRTSAAAKARTSAAAKARSSKAAKARVSKARVSKAAKAASSKVKERTKEVAALTKEARQDLKRTLAEVNHELGQPGLSKKLVKDLTALKAKIEARLVRKAASSKAKRPASKARASAAAKARSSKARQNFFGGLFGSKKPPIEQSPVYHEASRAWGPKAGRAIAEHARGYSRELSHEAALDSVRAGRLYSSGGEGEHALADKIVGMRGNRRNGMLRPRSAAAALRESAPRSAPRMSRPAGQRKVRSAFAEPQLTREVIAHVEHEGPCRACGQPLYMGDVAVYEGRHGPFCGAGCAR